MDEQRGFGHVSRSGDVEADSTFDAAARRRIGHPRISALTFHVACVVTGFFAALIVGVLFHETIGEPIGLLLAVAGGAWVLTSLMLYHVAKQRFCDRAIVMGGGLVSAVMCSMMFLE